MIGVLGGIGMTDHLNHFFTYYIMYLAAEFIFYYFIITKFELKIPRKKAFWLMFLFMNFMPVTDTIQLLVSWYNPSAMNSTTVIIFKSVTVLCEVMLILFLHTVCKDRWYQIYAICLIVHALILFPNQLLFVGNFTVYDEMTGYEIVGISWENIGIYICMLMIIITVGLAISKLGFYVKSRFQFSRIPRTIWFLTYFIWFGLLSQTNKFLTDEQYEAITAEWYIPGYNDQVGLVFRYIIAIVFIILIANIIAEHRVIKIENRFLKKINYHYVELENQQIEIHKLYHDIGNHIETMRVLVGSNDTEKASKYMKDLAENYRNIKKFNVCDNKIINAVLSQKLKYCDEHGIATEIDIHIPKDLSITDIDLMSLISNLVDNAIEACDRSTNEKKYINFSMRYIGDNLAIKVINSKESSMPNRKGSKSYITNINKKIHGYGLKIIDGIVKKYNGYQEIKDLGIEFSAMVLLTLKK